MVDVRRKREGERLPQEAGRKSRVKLYVIEKRKSFSWDLWFCGCGGMAHSRVSPLFYGTIPRRQIPRLRKQQRPY